MSGVPQINNLSQEPPRISIVPVISPELDEIERSIIPGKASKPVDSSDFSSNTNGTEETTETSEPQKRSRWSRMWSKSARAEHKEALKNEMSQKSSTQMTAGEAFNLARDKRTVEKFGKYSSEHNKEYKDTDFIVCKMSDGTIKTIKANETLPEGASPMFKTTQRAMNRGNSGYLSRIPSDGQRESAFNFFSEKDFKKQKTDIPENAVAIYGSNNTVIGYYKDDFNGPNYNEIREFNITHRRMY